jgi:hypothetical protein
MNYLEDLPESAPAFDFKMFAKALAPLLLQPAKGATVVGLHGDWGVGKTTLMNELQRTIERNISKLSGGTAEQSVCVSFNAWKFQDREALWRALILRVIGSLRQKAEEENWAPEIKFIQELEDSLYRAFEVEEAGPWKVNWRAVFTEILRLALAVIHMGVVADAIRESTGWIGRLLVGKPTTDEKSKDEKSSDDNIKEITGILERTTIRRHVEQVRSIEQFLGKYNDLIKLLNARKYRVFVFVCARRRKNPANPAVCGIG